MLANYTNASNATARRSGDQRAGRKFPVKGLATTGRLINIPPSPAKVNTGHALADQAGLVEG